VGTPDDSFGMRGQRTSPVLPDDPIKIPGIPRGSESTLICQYEFFGGSHDAAEPGTRVDPLFDFAGRLVAAHKSLVSPSSKTKYTNSSFSTGTSI
jgi:hypothetical protein